MMKWTTWTRVRSAASRGNIPERTHLWSGCYESWQCNAQWLLQAGLGMLHYFSHLWWIMCVTRIWFRVSMSKHFPHPLSPKLPASGSDIRHMGDLVSNSEEEYSQNMIKRGADWIKALATLRNSGWWDEDLRRRILSPKVQKLNQMTSYELYISSDGLGAAFSGLFLMIPDLGPEHGVRNLSSSDNLFPVTQAQRLGI